MKKSPEHAKQSNYQLNDAVIAEDLALPVDPSFVSLPPRIAFQVMLKRIEENIPWRSTRPGEPERRLAEKIPVEFVL